MSHLRDNLFRAGVKDADYLVAMRDVSQEDMKEMLEKYCPEASAADRIIVAAGFRRYGESQFVQ
jgi:hypothetical protein